MSSNFTLMVINSLMGNFEAIKRKKKFLKIDKNSWKKKESDSITVATFSNPRRISCWLPSVPPALQHPRPCRWLKGSHQSVSNPRHPWIWLIVRLSPFSQRPPSTEPPPLNGLCATTAADTRRWAKKMFKKRRRIQNVSHPTRQQTQPPTSSFHWLSASPIG